MSSARTSRRRFLKLVAGTGVASRVLAASALAPAASGGTSGAVAIADGALRIEFDSRLRSRAWHVRQDGGESLPLTRWAATEYLLLADGSRVEQFALRHEERSAVEPSVPCFVASQRDRAVHLRRPRVLRPVGKRARVPVPHLPIADAEHCCVTTSREPTDGPGSQDASTAW